MLILSSERQKIEWAMKEKKKKVLSIVQGIQPEIKTYIQACV